MLAPEALMIGAHFAKSLLISAANSVGDEAASAPSR